MSEYIFEKKLSQLIPVLKKETLVVGKHAAAHYIRFKNHACEFNSKLTVPYLTDCEKFLNFTDEDESKCIAIITSDMNAAKKAAVYIAEHNTREAYLRDSDRFEEVDDYIYECEVDESEYHKLRLIHLYISPENRNIGINPYFALLAKTNQREAVIFSGLSAYDAEDKLDAIEACPAYLKFIAAEPEQVEQPWFQRLFLDMNCDMLYPEKPGTEYYSELIHELFADSGIVEPDETTIHEFVRWLKKKRGRDFCEEDMIRYLDTAVATVVREQTTMNIQHLTGMFHESITVRDRLSKLIGLSSIKEILYEYMALSAEEQINPKLKESHKNMVFCGNPGTGKSMCAKIMSDILYESGTSCGAFTTAARSDIIGRYVGHTAGMIANRFEEAKGGVLFIDEAGFMVTGRKDLFINEAIKEFVRFMELYPDVTVIFAMYTGEVDAFMSLDAGISSRISRVLTFPDYSDEELINIASGMFRERGYSITDESDTYIREYISWLKKRTQRNFGNAREMRKLVEAGITEVSLRHFGQQRVEESYGQCMVLQEDIIKGIEKLKACRYRKSSTGFGFGDRSNRQIDTCGTAEYKVQMNAVY